MALQAVFIDRDGTLGGTGYSIHPRDGYGDAEFRHIWADVEPDFVAADLPAAVDWLLNLPDRGPSAAR